MASNKYDASTASSCRRFCRTERKNLLVPIPTMVQQYNAGMGGLDMMDNMVGRHQYFFMVSFVLLSYTIIYFYFAGFLAA